MGVLATVPSKHPSVVRGEAVPGFGGEVGVEDRLVLGVGDRHGVGGLELDGGLVEAAEAGERPGPRLVGVGEIEVARPAASTTSMH